MTEKTLSDEKWNEFFSNVDAKAATPSLFSALKGDTGTSALAAGAAGEGPQGYLNTPFTQSPLEKVIVDDSNFLIPRAVTSLKGTFDGIWRTHLRFAVFCAVGVFIMLALLNPPLVRDLKGKRDWRMILIYTLFSFLLTIFLPTFLNMSGSIASFILNIFS